MSWVEVADVGHSQMRDFSGLMEDVQVSKYRRIEQQLTLLGAMMGVCGLEASSYIHNSYLARICLLCGDMVVVS